MVSGTISYTPLPASAVSGTISYTPAAATGVSGTISYTPSPAASSTTWEAMRWRGPGLGYVKCDGYLWFGLGKGLRPLGNATVGTTPASQQPPLQSGSNAQAARAMIVGDSIVFGAAGTGNTPPKYSTSFPGQLRTAIAPSYGNAGTGVVLCNAAIRTGAGLTGGWDNRFTYSGTITDTAEGFFSQACWNLAPGASVSFQTTMSTFLAYLLAGSDGYATVSIDGGAPIKIRSIASGGTAPDLSPQTGHAANHLVTEVPTGTNGVHTATVTAVGGTVKMWAVEGRTGAGAVAVDNLGISGRTLNGLVSSSLPLLDTVMRQGPGVVLLELGVNDWQGGRSVSLFSQDLATAIARVRAGGREPRLYIPPQPSPTLRNSATGSPTFSQYVAAWLAAAAAASAPILNHRNLYTDDSTTDEAAIYAAGNSAGMYADTVHPSNQGAQAMVSGYAGKQGIQAFLGLGA